MSLYPGVQVWFKQSLSFDGHASHMLLPANQAGWERCQGAFGAKVYIMSNSAGSQDDAPEYLQADALEEMLGARVVRHGTKKPAGGDQVLQAVGEARQHVAFVGDRVLTDVVFANTHGLMAIHTQPLTLENDNYWAMQV